MSLNRVNADGSITRVAGGSTASSSVFVGTTAEWAAETDKTDFDAALITDAGTVNAVDDTTGDTEVVANKNLVFKGTLEEWEALTTAEKKAYDEALITNDMDTGEVVDAVTDGDMRAVTSNAVAGAIQIPQPYWTAKVQAWATGDVDVVFTAPSGKKFIFGTGSVLDNRRAYITVMDEAPIVSADGKTITLKFYTYSLGGAQPPTECTVYLNALVVDE